MIVLFCIMKTLLKTISFTEVWTSSLPTTYNSRFCSWKQKSAFHHTKGYWIFDSTVMSFMALVPVLLRLKLEMHWSKRTYRVWTFSKCFIITTLPIGKHWWPKNERSWKAHFRMSVQMQSELCKQFCPTGTVVKIISEDSRFKNG